MDLSKIKSTDLQRLIDIRKEKNKAFRCQKYEEAADLRDKERDIITNGGLEEYISFTLDALIHLTRDKKINDLLDDN